MFYIALKHPYFASEIKMDGLFCSSLYSQSSKNLIKVQSGKISQDNGQIYSASPAVHSVRILGYTILLLIL